MLSISFLPAYQSSDCPWWRTKSLLPKPRQSLGRCGRWSAEHQWPTTGSRARLGSCAGCCSVPHEISYFGVFTHTRPLEDGTSKLSIHSKYVVNDPVPSTQNNSPPLQLPKFTSNDSILWISGFSFFIPLLNLCGLGTSARKDNTFLATRPVEILNSKIEAAWYIPKHPGRSTNEQNFINHNLSIILEDDSTRVSVWIKGACLYVHRWYVPWWSLVCVSLDVALLVLGPQLFASGAEVPFSHWPLHGWDQARHAAAFPNNLHTKAYLQRFYKQLTMIITCNITLPWCIIMYLKSAVVWRCLVPFGLPFALLGNKHGFIRQGFKRKA